ncbi:TOMM precursor leader peptide-binding protein [Hymenobacter aquaticus]|uniref:TOMM leader peptide-binding protein n=1 Tax=Hymenobacter aquaticus TaxID=1867101 RepID=A0A4Z0PVT8_9BACT|nr:TOMM precursor leader peptide-binding protein [Hymenobacter aquaticus]TGE21376.1 TOMM precursor leader peptide-binding protein [Hymenobacter aquaticus]
MDFSSVLPAAPPAVQPANITLYVGPDRLFITDGDHNLIEVVGEGTAAVEAIISALRQHPTAQPADVIFDLVAEQLEHDRDFFDEIWLWLQDNGLVTLPEPAAPAPIATYLPPEFWPAAEAQEFLARLGTATTAFVACPLEEAELIVVLAPVLPRREAVLALARHAHERQIPLCHLSIERQSYTVGPLLSSRRQTPCLLCYYQRKLANLRNPEQMLTFVRHPAKKPVSTFQASRSNVYELALLVLRGELEKYFGSRQKYAAVLGKSLVFDTIAHTVAKSRVLALPHCPVCSHPTNHVAFNG